MHRPTLAALMFCVIAFATTQWAAARTPAPDEAKAYIISSEDGAVVSSPVTVRFGLEGMGVAPAGVENAKAGHHHLLIDAPVPDLNAPIPADDNHVHFGGGQTQTTIELARASTPCACCWGIIPTPRTISRSCPRRSPSR